MMSGRKNSNKHLQYNVIHGIVDICTGFMGVLISDI